MLFRQIDRYYLNKIDKCGNEKKEKKKTETERKCSRRRSRFLFAPMNRNGTESVEKASFCTSLHNINHASLAIETAMVLPLFFIGIVTIISFMDIYKLETEKLVSLCERTKEAGMYAYVLDESGPSEITLPDLYFYQPIGGWLSLPKVWLHNTVKVHAWTGKEAKDETDMEEDSVENMVLVTENGSVYHMNPACTYLDLSIKQIDGQTVNWYTNNYGQHYDACERCSKNQNPGNTVFITGSGTSYHNMENCSGLKRTVRLVPESQVEDMHVCSRCG